MLRLSLVLIWVLLSSCGDYCVTVTDAQGVPIKGASVLPLAPAFNPVSNSRGRLCFDYAGAIQADGYELHSLTEQELRKSGRFSPETIVLERVD